MRARIWGCRGSLASPGPHTLRYGGNTSTVEIRLNGGALIVLDAGTGIRRLGEDLAGNLPGRIHLLLTHLHLDHLEGLPFFRPLWEPDISIEIWGPSSPVASLEQNIARYMSPPLFPISLFEVPARCTFHSVSESSWEIGGARIRSEPVEHPGPTVGFRIEEGAQSLAYIPDHEPAASGDIGSVPREWVSGHGLAAGVGVLFHDAQYTAEEYTRKAGWGHSSVEASVAFAAMSGVERLFMFHHDPARTDTAIDDMALHAKGLAGAALDSAPAREDMVIDL